MADYDNVSGSSRLRAIRPAIQDYAWGIRGLDSRCARYALESGSIDGVNPSAPYAELWIGTHPKAPTTFVDGTSLESAVGGQLPFLFKILSAGKALSIQAHPDKTNAERLHAENPQAYGDSNHKPELAIALTPFEAMCGFRRIEEIAVLLKKHPEFAACISDDAKLKVFMCCDDSSKRLALKALFSSFMACDPLVSKPQLEALLHRLQRGQSGGDHPHPHEEPPWERKCARAVLRLSQQFPGDAGAMAPLFLNYLLIAPGESFFMAANEPHAYVAGEIIECMACSDNVVRAGLTPKFKDVDNLVGMLSYTMGGPSIDVGAPCADPRILRYTPPCPEFEVLVATCEPGQELTLPSLKVPSIFIVIEGSGATLELGGVDAYSPIILRPGRCYFRPAHGDSVTLTVNIAQKGPLKLALAHENLHIEAPTTVTRSPTSSLDEHNTSPTNGTVRNIAALSAEDPYS
mmetsp:Transcript_89502/g.178900  ORF Transcript_89502/g.178900 Transcript_89502/m.178900 type:complete len:461 (+) Transcript_89502:66-1448(+)